ncbi:MAG TPA: hypothetical protein VFO41_06300 [Alphaproteobacteria bacterium]|nr:hypothetical protein [Alphaproteobacteria bacterium]
MADRDSSVQFNRQIDRIGRRFPATRGFLHWVRKPSSRLIRIPIAILLILGGIFSILPVLGIWMLPLGLLLLALDVPFLQRPLVKALLWTERKWTNWKRKRRDRKAQS